MRCVADGGDVVTTDEEPTREEPSRIAGGCVAVVLTGAAGAVAYAVPETAYFVAGLLAAATVRKARGWATARRDREQPEAAAQVDIAEQLQALSDGGHHVLLTQLQAAADLPDTKAVRALLDEAGIRVRTGVRTPAGNGPGVHQDDIPVPLPRDGETPSGRCLCSSGANANTNNRPQVEHNEWGVTITDPTEQHRRHHVPHTH